MAGNPIFSYTRRDYEGSRKEGLAKIPALSQGQWTDLNATDPGIIILDYVHALVDMCNYYQDHQALEAFLSTARERANIFRLAKQLSYNIRSAKGARVDVQFSSPLVHDRTILIPKHTRLFNSRGDISYLTMEDAYLEKGKTTVSVRCYQGELFEKVYVGTGLSRFSTVEGAENQSISLTASNIDIETIEVVEVVDGNIIRTWEPIDYIAYAGPTDRVYQVDLNPDDTITIRFGDGVRGIIPVETDTLTVRYVITKAAEGRVGAGELVRLAAPVLDATGAYVELLVSNSRASTGGSSIESSSDIKALAPGAIKAQGRAVTLSDYENLAKLVPGVADAKAYDINTKPDLCLYHEVKVLVVPSDILGDSVVLQDTVYRYLVDKIIPPTNLQVLTPSSHPVDITIVVRKLDNEISSRIEYAISTAVQEYFKDRSGRIGEDFYPVDLATVIQKIPGIRYVSSITPNEIIQVSDMSIVSLGELSVIVQ